MGRTKFKRTVTRHQTSKAQFDRCCKCRVHDVVCEEGMAFKLYRVKGKELKKRYVHWLIEAGHLTVHSSWVCNHCVNFAKASCDTVSDDSSEVDCDVDIDANIESAENENATDVGDATIAVESGVVNSVNTNETNIEESDSAECDMDENDEVTESVERVIEMINDGLVNNTLLSKLAFAIGTTLNEVVYNETKTVLPMYRDINILSKLNEIDFLQDRPGALLSFLSGLTNVPVERAEQLKMTPQEKKKLLHLCLLIEQIYFVRSHNFIGPFSFSNQLVKWSLTGSKSAVKLDGATTASSGITTLKNFIADASKNPNTCFNNDLDVFADNTQKICRTTKIRMGGTTPVDVATNVVFIQSDPESKIQNESDLIPEKWLPDNG